ncbi:MAG: glycosyltransferase family 4 protein [Ruminococcus flavefaciens]|nr:glycosyltransferase family 4 protein [Roseburia sp.]MCM1234950.1 glycosyltransferase family 4 protein [Ruminococcus flavefaciens]
MHILFISDSDSKYGASQSMKQLISELLDYGENIEISVVLPLKSNLAEYYRQLGCSVYKILYEPFYQSVPEQKWKMPVKYSIRGIEYLIGKWTGLFCLSKRLNMNSIDIIHSNSSREDLGAALALNYNKPLIWHIREFGDKDYRCFSFRKDYIELMNIAASEFIAVSEAIKKHWIKKGLDENKIIHIYNGVTTDISVKSKYSKEDNHKLKLIMLGSICETKGQYQVINALGIMTEEEKKKITLDIVGEGRSKVYIKKLIKMVEEYGLSSSVKFLGYKKDFEKNISNYDCGMMCSKSEGFGRVTLEYMMAGLPVIASDAGANTEIVVNKENGFLYQLDNIPDLKEKIRYLLNNTELIETMGKKAKTYARTYFSSKLNAELIYKEYLKILKQ